MLNRGWAPLSGVVLDREKFIDLPIPERYDLAADPAEATNLAGRTPAQDRTLAASLAAFKAPAPGQRIAESPDAAARLRSLGYVVGQRARQSALYDGRRSEAASWNSIGRCTMPSRRSAPAVPPMRCGIYQGVIATPSRHGDRVPAPRVRGGAARQPGRRDRRAAARDRERRHQTSGSSRSWARLSRRRGTRAIRDSAARADRPSNRARTPETLNALGIAYASAGRHDEARRMFERVLRSIPAAAFRSRTSG